MKKYIEKDIFYTSRFGYTPCRDVVIITIRFRFDAVPGSGGRYNFKSYYRQMRTTQELRWCFPHKEYTRGKRRKKYLPTSWDDYPRYYKDRSWKACTKRRKQYK